MKIVMMSQHGCFRVMKMALPLVAMGYEVHLIVNKVTQFSGALKSVTTFQDQDQLYDAIRLHGDADVFHVHNEPSWFVTAVKEVFWDKPVILDVHDTFLLRRTPDEVSPDNPEYYRISVDERNNIQLADGLVYVCEPMRKEIEQNFKPTVPSIVLPSYVPKRFYRIDFARWWGGLVYEGRIDITDELGKKWDFFQYSNYLELGKKAAELNIPFHIYTPRKNAKVRETYGDVAIMHDPVGMDKLCKLLGAHDWGLVGNIKHTPEWQHALPNKLFDYMASCVPIVSINADESSRVIEEYGVGITVKSLEELAERWPEHRECRKQVVRHRERFAMESHIGDLEGLYREVGA